MTEEIEKMKKDIQELKNSFTNLLNMYSKFFDISKTTQTAVMVLTNNQSEKVRNKVRNAVSSELDKLGKVKK